MSASSSEVLETIYRRRFGREVAFRNKMWSALCRRFFQRFISTNATVLEVGAGYCEFINNIQAKHKLALDLNPDTARYAAPGAQVI